MEKDYQPLVSVPVITYNSSKTVVETLDSIYNQTYPNLELIVSDDCSTDNTIEICRRWIDEHRGRFARTELITIEKNTGISANMNRAEAACRGEWVKSIAGDDILLPHCIKTYVDYVAEHQGIIYMFARLIPFKDDGNIKKEVDIPIKYEFFTWPLEEQYHYLIFVQNQIPAPTAFYNKFKMMELEVTYDERIPMMEDYPRWINLLKKGVRFHFIDKAVVLYRLSNQSISNSSQRSERFNQSMALFYLYYQHNEIRKEDKARAVASFVSAKKTLTNLFFWRALNEIIVLLVKLKKAIIR